MLKINDTFNLGHVVIYCGRQNGRKTMENLLKKKAELEIKLDHYSRTDRVAFDRVLMDLFELELDIREMTDGAN